MNKRSTYSPKMGFYKSEDCEDCGKETERAATEIQADEAEALLPEVACACGWMFPAEWVSIAEEMEDYATSWMWA